MGILDGYEDFSYFTSIEIKKVCHSLKMFLLNS